ncbi:penicillin-binding transpeptidase domain-containing protein [Lactobacillus sp. ESL0791]|uniref:penicillin-binding transpeptidase domain-containing protein n=1 Tax=Lactobacillus sp. ESL0791 TaxID=2983234 RepID=UPI0023F87593|nr:penicillin-binding transpeptidase domain-containing protein [Lactobacillus sp. ESL0791]MDF7638805.1 penicillin-binding transpeptidase domain-containing protein [Lactobacillus sp. ESL0791]
MKKRIDRLKLQRSKAHHNRFTVGRFLQIVVALVFLVFVARLLYLGISKTVNGRNLSARTEQLYKRNQVLKATRGTIYDRNGLAIAEDSHSYTIYAILDKSSINYKNKPEYVVNKEKTAQELAKVLPLSVRHVLQYLSPKHNAFQVQFGVAGNNLTKVQKDKISAMKLPGIKFIETPARLYPNGNFATHIVGLAQPEEDQKTGSQNLVGTMGLEAWYDNLLSGKDGYQISSVDAANYQTPNSNQTYKAAQNGDNLYLTIDSQLQNLLENRLSFVQKTYKPVVLTAVVEDIKTGKVLAASQRPTFNPETKEGMSKSYRNILVQDTYEPGSVFKVLTLAASVNSGNFHPNQYYNSGTVAVNGSVIHDWQKSGWGSIPFSQAFPRSSNTGFVHIEEQMGAKTWGKYLKKFRIGEKTGVTLPGEQAGLISFKLPVDQVVTSFGQGVNVNVMQMMQAFSSLANDGQMVQPQYVDKVTNANGDVIKGYQIKKVGQPVYSAATRKVVLANMKQVLNKRIGTGYAYKMPGKSIAVKTGTAQIANRKHGGYLKGSNNYIFSVVGVTPADNPRYCIYITMRQPQLMTKPAETILSSIFKPLMSRVIAMSKDEEDSPTIVLLPKLKGLTYSAAKKEAVKSGFDIVKIGSGDKVIDQLYEKGQKQESGSRIFVLTSGKITCPDMKDWTGRDLHQFMSLTGIKLKIEGKGTVYRQSVKPGSALKAGTKVTVVLKE